MEIGGKLKYVGLELMKKDAKSTDTPEVGLFRGTRTRTEGDVTLALILLGDKETPDAIRGLNSEVFNIMTIMLKHGQTREMIVFKNTAEDQKEADGMLEVIIESLKKDGLMLESDPDIVDTEKYSEIDEEFFGAKKSINKTTNYSTGGRANTGTTGTTDWQKKQEEEKKEKARQEKLRWTPFSIKRNGDAPAIKDLNLIKKKIAALAAGDYEYELPKTPGDDKDKKTKAANK